jgi:hypothetical protein
VALIKCPECNQEISTDAAFCPHCGKTMRANPPQVQRIEVTVPPKTSCTTWGCLILVVFLVIGLFGGLLSSNSTENKTTTPQPTPPRSQADNRKEQIKTQFSAWDGSHRGLTALIKKTMNNPASYEHVETVYWDKGDHLIVKTTFRGTNAFGGIVTNWVMAKVDLNGNVIEVISQGP